MSYRVTDHAHRWGLCLRALDADTTQELPEEVATLLFPELTDAGSALAALMAEGNRLRAGDHRRILLLSD